MNTNKYQIQLLETFGMTNVKAQIYRPGITSVVSQSGVIADESLVIRRSKLGTAIFSDLQFDEITYKGITYNHTPIDLALYDINQAKIIQKTEIQGRDGAVKEYIAKGDYVINIKGIITGDNGVYPKSEVQDLINMLDLPVALTVYSDILRLFNIYQVVVESYHFPQIEGNQSQQPFEINCLSDEPVELKIYSASKTSTNGIT